MWFDYTSGRCHKCRVLDYVRQQPPVYHPLNTFMTQLYMIHRPGPVYHPSETFDGSVVDDLQMWPEWTSSHQCTSWLFCPLNGLCFFIWHRIHHCPFLFTADHCTFFYGGLLVASFSLDLSSHIATLHTFLSL